MQKELVKKENIIEDMQLNSKGQLTAEEGAGILAVEKESDGVA